MNRRHPILDGIDTLIMIIFPLFILYLIITAIRSNNKELEGPYHTKINLWYVYLIPTFIVCVSLGVFPAAGVIALFSATGPLEIIVVPIAILLGIGIGRFFWSTSSENPLKYIHTHSGNSATYTIEDAATTQQRYRERAALEQIEEDRKKEDFRKWLTNYLDSLDKK